MVKLLIVFVTVIYTMIGFGTWIGFNQRYVRACPNDPFTFGPVLAGAIWPLFAGARIGGLDYGTVECGNKW